MSKDGAISLFACQRQGIESTTYVRPITPTIDAGRLFDGRHSHGHSDWDGFVVADLAGFACSQIMSYQQSHGDRLSL